MGRTTSDLARTVGASRLREIENFANFREGWWVKRIVRAGDNLAVLGFLIERAVLGVLITNGTRFAGPEPEFNKAPKLQKFSGRFPNEAPQRDSRLGIIYVPTVYSYTGVDAILAVCVKKKDMQSGSKTIVIGIQVTISNYHSDSEAAFMRSWQDWDELMASNITIFRFIWIVETITEDMSEDWEDVQEKVVTRRGKRSIMHPAYQRRYISLVAFDEEVGKCLEAARGGNSGVRPTFDGTRGRRKKLQS